MYSLKDAFHYRNQFVGLEWFRNVCIHATAKSRYAVSRFILCCKEDNGNQPGSR
jgi:hypothetical protein